MPVEATFTEEEARALVETKEWYHRYEVFPGVITPGKIVLKAKKILDLYGFPKDVTGKRILEIGAFDGAYTFELERRGGIVTAMDIQDKDSTGFAVGHKLNNSRANYVRCDVKDLSSKTIGKFDIVLFLGVYYHILNPVLAFQNIFDVLEDGGTVYYSGHILDYGYRQDFVMQKYQDELKAIVDKIPLTLFAQENYAGVWSNWYIPNLLCLRNWLTTSGFEIVKERIFKGKSVMGGYATKIRNFRLAPGFYKNMWTNIANHEQDLCKYKKIMFYGAGSIFTGLSEEISDMIPPEHIVGVADQDSSRWGQKINGISVISPEEIPSIKPDLVIVTSWQCDAIVDTLEKIKLMSCISFDTVVIFKGEHFLDTSTGHEIYGSRA